ncbi:MAG TPA: carbonate dehydratase, partial [Pseudomonas sp.]|nr:carbonate dehydratase [Pseudomonas sp.]
MPEQQTRANCWHACQADEALRELEASPAGLTHDQVKERLASYGPNRLDEAKPASVLQRLLRHLNNVLLYVLIAAALVTGLMGHWVDTFVILVVVVLNVAIGFVQEGKAEKA